MKSKEELKKLFENGDKPTQENFWEWQDSYWHKDEKLPTETVGLYKIKGSVPNKVTLDNMTSMVEGDVYSLLDTGNNYVYVLDLNNTGSAGWDKLSGDVDLSTINLQTVLDNGGEASNANSSYRFNLADENQNAFSQILQLSTDNEYKTVFSQTMENVGDAINGGAFIDMEVANPGTSFGVRLGKYALQYLGNYSANFGQNSLVDKAYVDLAIENSKMGNFIPMTGVIDGQNINGAIIIGNTSDSPSTEDEYRTRIHESFNYSCGNLKVYPYQNNTDLTVDRKGLALKKYNPLSGDPINGIFSNFLIQDNILLDRTVGDTAIRLLMNNTDLSLSGSKASYNADEYTNYRSTISINPDQQRIKHTFINPDILEEGNYSITEFITSSLGLTSNKDFSSTNTDFDFVQKKYVDMKIKELKDYIDSM